MALNSISGAVAWGKVPFPLGPHPITEFYVSEGAVFTQDVAYTQDGLVKYRFSTTAQAATRPAFKAGVLYQMYSSSGFFGQTFMMQVRAAAGSGEMKGEGSN